MKPSSSAAKAKASFANLPTCPPACSFPTFQGLAQLATHATLGVTGLAENVQGNVYKTVAKFFGPWAPDLSMLRRAAAASSRSASPAWFTAASKA